MKKNCFARMRPLLKAASGSDAPAAGASASEKSLLRFKRLFFKPIDYEVRSCLYVNRTTKQKILEIVAKTGNSQLTATAYVENILQHHLATFRNAINQLHQKQNYHNII